jgi:phthalate 4,5-dioxygenase oxygenase subunit
VDKEAMRNQRLQFITLPDYIPKSGRTTTGASTPKSSAAAPTWAWARSDINVHDQWAVESMGAIQDRTREHLGTSDKVIMANRRMLLKAIETVQAGGTPPGVADAALAAQMHDRPRHGGRHGPRPAPRPTWWRDAGQAKRDRALDAARSRWPAAGGGVLAARGSAEIIR